MPRSAEAVGRKLYALRRACARVKTQRAAAAKKPEMTKFPALDVGGATAETCYVCLASLLPSAAFTVAGVTSAYVTGPAAVLSVLLAAGAVCLAGWSFSTLSGRSWRHLQTSVYELVYRNCGEVLAVVVGYLLLLKHVSFSALVCRSVGQNVDMLTSGTVSNWTATNIGGLAPVDSRIDPVGAALAVVIVLLGRLRQPEWLRRRKLWFEAATTAAVLGTLLFTFVVALFHLHFDNWTGVDNFFPHGLRGILAGASCFYAFYDVYVELLGAGTSGGNHVTRRHLVTPSAVTVAVLVVATLGVTSTTTLTSPFPQSNWTSGAPMAESFDLSGVAWTKYYISAVAIVSLLPAAILQVHRGLAMIGTMSRDGLLLAFSTVGGDREPSAILFVILAVTLGAAVLNQTTLVQLVSGAAIISQMLTAACNVETQYRPCNSDVVKRSRRRNRNRKLNYESRTAAMGAVACGSVYDFTVGDGTSSPESSTVTTTVDVHVTAGCFSTPEVTSSKKPDVIDVTGPEQSASMYSNFDGGSDSILEDDDELVSERGGRAGSGNCDSGSSSSSDTDIDEIVDEFEQRRMAAVAQARADDQLIDIRCASDVTHRQAVRAVVAFTISGLTAFAVIAHAPRPGNPAAVVACVLAVLGALGSAVYLTRLPHNDVMMTSLMRLSPGTNSPSVRWWVALLSLAVHCCLLAAVTGTSCVLVLVWIIVGVVVYFAYGIRHSVAAKSLQHVPDEQRILLPDDDHVTQSSDDVSSGSGRRHSGNSLRRDANGRMTTPLRL